MPILSEVKVIANVINNLNEFFLTFKLIFFKVFFEIFIQNSVAGSLFSFPLRGFMKQCDLKAFKSIKRALRLPKTQTTLRHVMLTSLDGAPKLNFNENFYPK